MQKEDTVDDMLKAGIYLKAVLPLMEDLVAYDAAAARVIDGKQLILQFEVKNGPSAHLMIRDNAIRHGCGKHPMPNVRLTFKTPEMLNRMFDGEDIRPGLRKGFFHLYFLIKKFPELSERLTYFLEAEGKAATDDAAIDFQVQLGLHAMLCGMRTVATDDPDLRTIADETPFGTLLVNVLPHGPHGTFSKIKQNGGYAFTSTFNQPVKQANAVMEFADADAAKRLIDGELNAVTAIGIGKDIKISGLLPLIEKASIFLYKFAKIMEP
jgi:hypothetical protein